MMSVGKKTIQYTVAAALVAVAIIGASFVYIGIPNALTSGTSTTSSGSAIGGPTSTLVIQLTDPPQVPSLTTSLNLTYSYIGILAAEPTSPGKVNTTTVTIHPPGGNATVDLLKLQNLSQTMASASLPNDSVIYSVSFNVTSIHIEVNGSSNVVTMATGSHLLTITIANPSSITGTNVALLQLNPVVVDTSSGYQMIPSAVGILQHNHGQGESQVGSQHQLDQNDSETLDRAKGNATVTLLSLQVSGNQTTMTVQVNNTGTIPVAVVAVGVHGNFTVSPPPCAGLTGHSQGGLGNVGSNSSGGDGITFVNAGDSGQQNAPECHQVEHPDQVVFVVSAVTNNTVGGCVQGSLSLVSGDIPEGSSHGNLTFASGECADLTFSGTISFGNSQIVLTPSTLSGQAYVVALVASHGANQQVSCVLTAGTPNCTTLAQQRKSGGD